MSMTPAEEIRARVWFCHSTDELEALRKDPRMSDAERLEIECELAARDEERNMDLIEARRLSLEFNSPMNREAQKFLGRRFKRASDAPVQVSMFEETPEPDQRRLF